MDALRERRVLVTGAGGFIGAHVVRQLQAAGADVHPLTRRDADIRDPAAVAGAVRRIDPEIAVHLAAFSHVGRSWDQVAECVETNVQGTIALLDALRGTGCRRLVQVSTSDVYGDIPAPFREDDAVDPVSPYATSKYAAERFCLLYQRSGGPPVVIVRPFNAYGPGQPADRVVPEIIAAALRGDDVRMTEGRQTREFNHVDDIAAGIVAAATADDVEGEVLNLGCGEDIAVRDVATTILELMGNPVAARFGALPGRPNEISRMVADPAKARKLLGWEPAHDLRTGLAATIDWYREHG